MKNKMNSHVRMANKAYVSITAMSGKCCLDCSARVREGRNTTSYVIKIKCYQPVNQTMRL